MTQTNIWISPDGKERLPESEQSGDERSIRSIKSLSSVGNVLRIKTYTDTANMLYQRYNVEKLK